MARDPIQICIMPNHRQINCEVRMMTERCNEDLHRLIETGVARKPVWIDDEIEGDVMVSTVRLICG